MSPLYDLSPGVGSGTNYIVQWSPPLYDLSHDVGSGTNSARKVGRAQALWLWGVRTKKGVSRQSNDSNVAPLHTFQCGPICVHFHVGPFAYISIWAHVGPFPYGPIWVQFHWGPSGPISLRAHVDPSIEPGNLPISRPPPRNERVDFSRGKRMQKNTAP